MLNVSWKTYNGRIDDNYGLIPDKEHPVTLHIGIVQGYVTRYESEIYAIVQEENSITSVCIDELTIVVGEYR